MSIPILSPQQDDCIPRQEAFSHSEHGCWVSHPLLLVEAAAQALSRLHEAFQIDLPLRTIFDAPTVAGLAEKVEQKLFELVESLSDEEVMSILCEH